MITARPISESVRNSLKRKRDSLNKLNLQTEKPISEIFDTNQYNPFGQQFLRTCFAKVSVAVPDPDKKDESEYVKTPISISSYFNSDSDYAVTKTLESFKSQQNGNISFVQGYEELNGQNRFRGHSGITKIAVDQQGYTTFKTTVDWVCPDPVYFEEVFEPNFLKMGAYCAIEFGWGIDDRNQDGEPIPSLTIDVMKDIVKNGIESQNRVTSGNYYLNTGIITKFNWKIEENGNYTGNLEIYSKGKDVLNSRTQETNKTGEESIVPFKSIFEKESLRQTLIQKQDQLTEEEFNNVVKSEPVNQENYKNLFKSSISFQSVIKNLDKVLDTYLTTNLRTNRKSDIIEQKNNPYSLLQNSSNPASDFSSYKSYYFKDGVLKVNSEFGDGRPQIRGYGRDSKLLGTNEDLDKDRYFVSWGFFEDIILNSFFELQDENGATLQQVRSIKKGKPLTLNIEPLEETTCVSANFMYTNGLDGVILPEKHHPIHMDGFKVLIEKSKRDNPEGRDLEKLKALNYVYDFNHRVDMTKVYHFFKIINKNFKPFEKITSDENKLGVGVIRNMVFPIEMIQKHFQNMTTLKQGLRNFWADVNNQYGRFWNFKIGEDENFKGRIGISDVDEEQLSTKEETEEKPTNTNNTKPRIVGDEGGKKFDYYSDDMFVFNVYSQDSIVKSFDIQLDLSQEAATMAAYGHFADETPTSKNIPSNLPTEAWSLLNKEIGEKDLTTKSQYERFIKLGKTEVGSKLKIPTLSDGKGKSYEGEYQLTDNKLRKLVNDGIEFFKIKEIEEDTASEFQRIETKRFQFVDGIGIYDKKGNMIDQFKQIMVHLITSSTLVGSGSKIQKGRIVLPIKLTMTLDGVGGLKPGDSFRIDYLPKVYRENCYFMITDVNHSVDTTGWTTDINAVLKVDMANYWVDKKQKLDNSLIKLADIFKFNTNENYNVVPADIFGTDFETTATRLQELTTLCTETIPNQIEQASNDGKKRTYLGQIKTHKKEILTIIDDLKNTYSLRLQDKTLEQLERLEKTAQTNLEDIDKVLQKYSRYDTLNPDPQGILDY